MRISKMQCNNCKNLFDPEELIEQNEYYLHTEVDDGQYEKIVTYRCPKCYSSDLKGGIYDTETEEFSY